MEVRKFAHVPNPPSTVRALFTDIEAWPGWMPGVRRVDVLERSEDRLLVAIDQRLRGRTARQVMEFRRQQDGVRQIQLEGWFKKWDAKWRFLEPPDGEGTTLALTVDFDLGLAGLFSPRRLVESTIDGVFRDIVRAACSRTEELHTLPTAAAGEEAGETLIEVLEVAGRLEVVWGRRRFALRDD